MCVFVFVCLHAFQLLAIVAIFLLCIGMYVWLLVYFYIRRLAIFISASHFFSCAFPNKSTTTKKNQQQKDKQNPNIAVGVCKSAQYSLVQLYLKTNNFSVGFLFELSSPTFAPSRSISLSLSLSMNCPSGTFSSMCFLSASLNCSLLHPHHISSSRPANSWKVYVRGWIVSGLCVCLAVKPNFGKFIHIRQ